MEGGEVAYLAGASIQQVDAPLPCVWVLSLRLERETRALVVLPGAVGVVDSAPRGNGGAEASAFTMRLRKWLEGARVIGIARRHDGFCLLTRRGEERCGLQATTAAVSLLEVADAESQPLPADQGSLLDQAASVALIRHQGALEQERRRAVVLSLRRALAKIERRHRAILEDLARMAGAAALSMQATLLVAQAHLVGKGAAVARLEDWSTGTPVEIPLDPSLSARANADKMFARSKRQKRGVTIARARLASAEAERDALSAVLSSVTTAPLADLERHAKLRAPTRDARGEPAARSPFRIYESGGRPIRVGRGAKDNDALTTQARPQDLWLHARGVTGAHVVVPLSKQEACPSELLLDAAHLAAHFSDARGEAVVDVQYTPRKFVRKPRGAPPGAVTVEREKVLVLRVEPARLSRLLEGTAPDPSTGAARPRP